jgi:hypothetical protein
MKFNFRKITSALASTAMVTSTVALAAAANFPAPFVANGSADAAIVYGNNLDLVAVTDISSSLNTALAGSESVEITDDAYPLFTTSTPLQLNSSINTVRSSVVESNLPSVLTGTSFSGDVEANVDFRIILGNNPRTVFGKIPTSNDDGTIAVSYSTTSKKYLYNASATFSKKVGFNNTDSEGESITLFGQDFVVGTATDNTNLVLFRSAERVSLSVGGTNPNPSETVEVDGETYTVELVGATDTSATLRVTDSSGGSDTKEINEATSKKIRGIEVAVDIADESTATDSLSALIIVGANKMTLTDDSEVKVGTDDTIIEGTNVDFQEGNTDPGNVTKLTIQVFAADGSNDALKSGDALVDPVFGSFRIALTGLVGDDDREDISIDVSGNDKMNIEFTNWQDKTKKFEWVNNESSGWGKRFLGDSTEWRIFNREMAQINESAFAVVGNEETGYLVRLQSITNTTGTKGDSTRYSSDVVKFENVFDSTETWTATITEEGTGDIVIGGKTYTVTYWDDKDGDNDEYVRLNYPDSTAAGDVVVYPTIQTSKGARLFFYEPLTINLVDWDGKNGTNNVTKLRFPDGDGYTDLTVQNAVADGEVGRNWTIGGFQVNTTGNTGDTCAPGVCSAYPVIGKLTYNITAMESIVDGAVPESKSAGTGNDTIVIQLMDPGSNSSTIQAPAIVMFEEKDENNNYEVTAVILGGSGDSNNGIGVSDVDFTWNNDADMVDGSAYGASGFQRESSDKLYDMMNLWGTMVTTDQSTSDQYTAVISYPDNQVAAMLYVDSLSSGGGSSALGDITVMDSELASSGMAGKNLLVVGGSCVNSLASQLLGGAGCGASWTAATGASSGEFVIETFANPNAASKVATLVAGFEQGDTRNAATYLTTQTVDTSTGKKYKGTTSTSATLVTA